MDAWLNSVVFAEAEETLEFEHELEVLDTKAEQVLWLEVPPTLRTELPVRGGR